MKVLVVIRRSPTRRFLVELHTDKLIKEISKLVARRRHSQAIATALAKGRFEREIFDSNLHDVRADVILTEENVHLDLMK